MKQYMHLLFAVGLLAGCDAQHAEQAATPDATQAATSETSASQPESAEPTPSKPVTAPDGQKGVDLLAAAGVDLAFSHAINYDILDVSRNGTPRHRVLVEVLGDNFMGTVKQFDQVLAGLGYTVASNREEGGRIDRIYTSAGKPTYYLLMQAVGAGPKLGNPDATGSLHIMWNVR
jgi:hypothetical protein